LAGDLRRLSGVGYSHVAGDCVLKLSVLERGPYTHVFTLTYVFGSDPARYALAEAPNLAIRVYHDARVADAHAFAESAARTRGGEEALGLEARWSRNMMLNKWLEYCVERGHRFAPERSAMHPPTV
jgi:uncharacterized protein YqiB (DUF1249 family)